MSRKITPPSREELEELYTKPGSTISTVSRHYSVTNPTVRKWLIDYGIERKDHKTASTEANNRHRLASIPTREEFVALYEDMNLTELQSHFRVGQETIYDWMDALEIQPRSLSEATTIAKRRAFQHLQIPKEIVEREYLRLLNKTLLAEHLGISGSHLKKLMAKYEIETVPVAKSAAEKALFDFCQSLRPDLTWVQCDRTIIQPNELDIVCPELKLAIEYGGMYWHSERYGGKKRDYHRSKLLQCREAGYSLVTIFESDDIEKVKSHLAHRLGKSEPVDARKCEVVELSSKEARAFHEANHMAGYVGASVHLGLTHRGELVQVVSFGKSRFNKKYEWECTRSSLAAGKSVRGGTSRLFKRFLSSHSGGLVTYSDLRFGEGKVYESCGLKRLRDAPPNYWYYHKSRPPEVFSRVKFQKHKLSGMASFDERLTEWEIMQAERYDRIWDCGNGVYVTP